jgi:hypothetical protein
LPSATKFPCSLDITERETLLDSTVDAMMENIYFLFVFTTVVRSKSLAHYLLLFFILTVMVVVDDDNGEDDVSLV